MARHSTVCINDNFSPGQAAITLRAANNKTAGWIDMVHCLLGKHFSRQNLFNQLVTQLLAQFFNFNHRVMLSRNHNRRNMAGHAFFIIFHRHLRFTVRPQPRQIAVLAHSGQLLHQLMSQHNRHWHQLRRFPAGIAKHQALVARAAHINAHGNV